jgi:hypothetical protein
MFKRLARITIILALAAIVWLLLSTGSDKQVQPYQLIILLGVLFFYVILSKRSKRTPDEDPILPSTRRQRKGHRSWIQRIDQD